MPFIQFQVDDCLYEDLKAAATKYRRPLAAEIRLRLEMYALEHKPGKLHEELLKLLQAIESR